MIDNILIKSLEHLELAFIALFITMLIAIPLGIILAKLKMKWIASLILRSTAILQTIPGLALLALIVVFFAFLHPIIVLPITGIFPAVLILVFYAFFPLISNTYVGIKQVPSSMVDVAKAMGMKPSQILLWVEIPLSLPVIFTGIRFALVSIIGLGTLTSLIGSGGLGVLILQGLRTMQLNFVLAGTIPAAVMAIFFDWILESLGKWLFVTPA